MSAIELFLLRFLLASLASVGAGLAVWVLCRVLRHFLPGLALQRTVWLLAQVTVAAAFAMALLPQPQRVHLLPAVDVEAVDAAVARYIEPAHQQARHQAPAATEQAAAAGPASWLAAAALGWFVMYLIGLAWHAVKWQRAQRLVRQLAAVGAAIPARGSAVPVMEVDASISPMLLGLWQPRLLVPRHLRSFDPVQQRLIVEHELTHWRRRDLHWLLAGVVLQTLLWFNPFMRLLRARLLWAQELGCDRDVLRGRPVQERKAYAAALVAQLKLQCAASGAALAFGGVSADTIKDRIALIRTPSRRSRRARLAAIGMLVLAAAGSYALQPALALQHGAALHPAVAVSCLAMADAASGTSLLHQGQCDIRVTPLSTFNIAVSLMGYDSGILTDEHAPRLPYKDNYGARNPLWRAATDPTEWIRNSTVWYAQQVAQRLGASAFQRYIDQFGYGNRDASGDPGQNNGLRQSWIGSSLQISPDEQVAFLRRIVKRELGLAPHAYDMTSRLLKVRTLDNGWTVYGKTGTGFPAGADGKDDRSRSYGWFVGWAAKGERTIVFARFTQDQQEHDEAAGPRARAAMLRELPARLDAL